jgi:squalene synthase HpnC
MTIRSFSYTTAEVGPPPALPDASEILGRAAGENFPVASMVLAKESRHHLFAFYGFARLVDYLGDEYQGDRLAALDWLEQETRAALDEPRRSAASSAPRPLPNPLVVEAATSARNLMIDPQPLFDLVEANRMDQRVESYETFEDLLTYCRLSANPVGRLALGVFHAEGAEQSAYSDAMCTGLQLVEHWQDVLEDARAGRVYIPSQDLHRFGVDPSLLARGPATPDFRALMVFEVARARSWLDRGLPLLTLVDGRVRWAVAGFWAGGHAALDAIARRDFDVLRPANGRPALSWARHMARALGPRVVPAGKS